MILTTLQSLPGYRIVRVIGLVKGNTIRARDIGRDFIAVLKNITGGEIEEYTKMIAESREQAIDRLVNEADNLNADAVIGVRFGTTSVMNGAAEILAYGTAVVIEPES
jgi:uncharacterized protein YbjQ (UPF0145 family)